MAPLPKLKLVELPWRPSSNAELAAAYAARGVRVFPCRPDRFAPSLQRPKGDPEAKAPCAEVMWQGKDPSDPAKVAAWWRRWPNALVGIGLGDANLLVIDVDGGEEGVALWESYAAWLGITLIGVPIVDTPTVGRHYFFRLPDGVQLGNGRGALPKKAELPVDVRGTTNGYVIAAGTERPFWGSYRPAGGDVFAWLDAPMIEDALLEVLENRRPPQEEAHQAALPAIVPTVGIENRRVRAWVESAFSDEIGGVSSCGEGGRNEQLNKAAFALGQFVPHLLSEGEVRAALVQAARDCGIWKDDGPAQCRKTINSGFSKGMKEPRPIPADILREEAMIAEGREIARQLVRKKDGTVIDEETGEIVHDPSEWNTAEADAFPEHLTRVPGLMGEIVDWIEATARRPNRTLALTAAIIILGTALGRHVCGPTKSATHTYMLVTAPTGAGKDHAMQQIKRVLKASSMGRCIGPDGFTASTAVLALMVRTPLTVALIDEFGAFLKRINSRKAGGFEREISKVLRSLWGANFGSTQTPEWTGKPAQTIYAPALSLYGITTAAEFYRSLEGGDITNGFLNRFLMLSVDKRPEEVEPIMPDNEVPANIVEGVKARFAGGNALTVPVVMQYDHEVVPQAIPWADERAYGAYRTLLREIEIASDKDERREAFFARTAEMAVRLATIRASGRNAFKPAVSVDDLAWGRDVAWWSATNIMRQSADYIAETESQEWANTVVRILKNGGGSMKKRDLLRKLQHRLKSRDLKDLLEAMQSSGTIVISRAPKKDTGGPPSEIVMLGGHED